MKKTGDTNYRCICKKKERLNYVAKHKRQEILKKKEGYKYKRGSRY